MTMQVSMEADSGLLVYNFLDRPFPVIGWCAETNEDGATILYPLILRDGSVARMAETGLRYRLVGTGSSAWAHAVDAQNARVQFPANDGVALPGERGES